MKKILYIFMVSSFFLSCSNIQTDAEKACKLMGQFTEDLGEIMELSMKSALGNEEAGKELEKIQSSLEKKGQQVEDLKSKYTDIEWIEAMRNTCSTFNELETLGEELENLGDLINE